MKNKTLFCDDIKDVKQALEDIKFSNEQINKAVSLNKEAKKKFKSATYKIARKIKPVLLELLNSDGITELESKIYIGYEDLEFITNKTRTYIKVPSFFNITDKFLDVNNLEVIKQDGFLVVYTIKEKSLGQQLLSAV